MDTAKIVRSGRSQAMRLPEEFHFEGSEARIRRHGNSVILEHIAKDWDWLKDIAGPLDEDFVEAANEQAPDQKRPDLDGLD